MFWGLFSYMASSLIAERMIAAPIFLIAERITAESILNPHFDTLFHIGIVACCKTLIADDMRNSAFSSVALEHATFKR